jgi:hypothetical protein
VHARVVHHFRHDVLAQQMKCESALACRLPWQPPKSEPSTEAKFQEAANSVAAKVELHSHLLNVGEVFIASSATLITQLLDPTVKG